jgi:hypothetical protein
VCILFLKQPEIFMHYFSKYPGGWAALFVPSPGEEGGIKTFLSPGVVPAGQAVDVCIIKVWIIISTSKS